MFAVFERASRSRVVSAIVGLVLTELAPSEPRWPAPRTAASDLHASVFAYRPPRAATPPSTFEDELVKKQPLCVASSVRSAGTLGATVLYRYRRDGDALYVGYFVYFSTERPWGDNALTRRVVPALAIDAFYSHFLFVLPGAQRVLYGPGDIEGALVRYRIEGERLVPEAALADDEGHHRVRLRGDELETADGHVVLLTETWSHQLGAHDAVRRAHDVTCFDGARLEPLSADVAEAFRLGSESAPHRAKPAWQNVID
ncbi:MAG TPA: hypothetical protein VMI54_10185 [Polyangiaceae bacterium]|nr:hypothetical protein [Polyangiaceae bacterium]